MDERNRDRHCVFCGAPFASTRAWQQYCSLQCGRASRAATKRQAKEETGRYCKQCGTLFHPSLKGKSGKRLHCSDACARKSARESRSHFYERNPHKYAEYRATKRAKSGPDGNLKRIYGRYPDLPRACQSCGETRVLDAAHKPQYRRNGAWRSLANTTPEKIWILCPTCHALLDRMHYDPGELGLS